MGLSKIPTYAPHFNTYEFYLRINEFDNGLCVKD